MQDGDVYHANGDGVRLSAIRAEDLKQPTRYSIKRSIIITAVCLSFGPIGLYFTVSVTEACARRPGAAAATRLRQARPLSACICFELKLCN